MHSHIWVICYDISDDARLLRVAQALQGWGRRVQWSVFECTLTAGELAMLRPRLQALIDPATDSLRYYPLCAWCRQQTRTQGPGPQCGDHGYFEV